MFEPAEGLDAQANQDEKWSDLCLDQLHPES